MHLRPKIPTSWGRHLYACRTTAFAVSFTLGCSSLLLARLPVAAISAGPAYGQKKMANDSLILLTGKVKDEKGSPLPGVSISAVKSKKTTTTNEQGNYTLPVEKNDRIVFSFIGYNKVEAGVNGTRLLNMTMEKATKGLNEVVVTGFQQVDKTHFAGAAVKLKGADIKTDGVTDVSRMLEGRVAGLSVQTVSGTFGAAPKIRIRTATSISGDNKPLWVVDGVVLEDIVNVSNEQLTSGDPATLLGSSVAGLNVNDIETIDILKDASATGLYGARAMNGVIVITTKKGRIGKPVINYSGSFTSYLKPSYRNFDIMDSKSQMAVYLEMKRKGWLNYGNTQNARNFGVFGKMYSAIDQFDANNEFGLANNDGMMMKYLERYADANTDWFNTLFRNSLAQDHTISLSAGSEKSQNYASVGLYNDNGWTIADKAKRFTFNFRNTTSISDKLSISISANGNIRQQRQPGASPRISNVVSGGYIRNFDINPFQYALNTSRAITPYDESGQLDFFTKDYAPFNILHEIQNNYINLDVWDAKLLGNVTYKFSDAVKFDFTGIARYARTAQENIITENSNEAQAYRSASNTTIQQSNPFLFKDYEQPNKLPSVMLPYGGFYNTENTSLVNYEIRNQLSFNKTYAEKHGVSLTGGQQLRFANRKENFNQGIGFQYNTGNYPYVDNDFFKQMNVAGTPYYGSGASYDRYVAFYGTGQYTYDEKYVLNATARWDGSNKLGATTQARWLPTWSVAGRWNLNREAFMSTCSHINLLSLRVSYGLNANIGKATNSLVQIMPHALNRPLSYMNEPSIAINSLENNLLTWEKNKQFNVGIDFIAGKTGWFEANVDVYARTSFNLIDDVQTSGIGGEMVKPINMADMSAKGIDAHVGITPVRNATWTWKSDVNFGYSNTKITRLLTQPNIFDLTKPEGGHLTGYPLNALFSVPFAGLEPQYGYPQLVNENNEVSTNVNMQSTHIENLHYEGPVEPTFFGGWNNTFRYKGISVSCLITYQAGNKIRLNPAYYDTHSDLEVNTRSMYDRWEMPGDEKITNVPSIVTVRTANRIIGYPYNTYNYTPLRVVDGSFVRLKSISATYNLPGKWFNNFFSMAALSLTGNNLFLIYSDKRLNGQDPEFFNAGGVAVPVASSLSCAVKLGF